MYNEEEVPCLCCQKHVPLPTTYRYIKIGKDVVCLCPTTFDNVENLMVAFRSTGGVPPGSITKHYSKYVREICFRIWKENKDQLTVV